MKKAKMIMLLPIAASVLCSCTNKVNNDNVFFTKDTVVTKRFRGMGVEWGAYEDTKKLKEGYWDTVTRAVDRLNPELVRCMVSYDWFVKDFDNKGDDDLSNDTWAYDFDNKWMKSACEILEYCFINNIDVAFGAWNPVGNANPELDEWKMIPNETSDPRWAKMTTDVLTYLYKVKGYTCIKWFVNSNEPNYTGAVGSSKNAYNTYELWETGVKNVRKALDDAGLNDIDIIGGDVTGFSGVQEYLPNISKNLKDVVNNYGIHMYVSNIDIQNGNYQNALKQTYDTVKKNDPRIGEDKDFIIWEAGLLDGKDVVLDKNLTIRNFSYGLRICDYTVSSLLGHVNGVVYWDLDDAMHFMYTETGVTPKEWGMFSTLASAPVADQELRPWYHAATLMTNLIRKNSRIYAPDHYQDNFKTLAVIDNESFDGGIIAVNRELTGEITKTFTLTDKISHKDGVFVYIFNESSLLLDSDGFVQPNLYKSGVSLNDSIEISIPANSVVILSSKKL